MRAEREAAWPSGVRAHLAGCEDCAAIAIELWLQQAPASAIPSTFAADVARRVRQEASPERARPSGIAVSIGAAGILLGIAVAWIGVSGEPTAILPVATLLLACGEAIALAAWTLDADVIRARWRR
jgi:hypothetical protein